MYDEISVVQQSKFNFTVNELIGWIESISVDGEMQIKFNNTLIFNLANQVEDESELR